MGQVKELEFMIGKRVRVKDAIKVCYMSKMQDVVGKLSFIGSSELLNIPLLVTIDRMPIKIKSLTQLELEEDETQ